MTKDLAYQVPVLSEADTLPHLQPATSAEYRLGMQKLNLLILNGDLPVFPGWGGIEYLHTIHLAQLAHKVGLVSQVHTLEQSTKKQRLIEAGVKLHLWESPNLIEAPAFYQPPRSSFIRRLGKSLFGLARTWPKRPQDTANQDFQFRNMSPPLLQALNEESWQALLVIQSTNAHWLDYLPSFPVTVLMLHDVRARVYARRAQTAGSLRERVEYQLQAWLYRRFEHRYCQKYDLVVTVSAADEAWVREHYQPNQVITIPIPVDSHYFAPLPDVSEAKARIVFTGLMNHPPNSDAACFFAHQVFPKVRAKIPEAEFYLCDLEPGCAKKS
jgi:glycosyltransferase involved in cell wall biosynthesis